MALNNMDPETILLVDACEDDVFFFKRALNRAAIEHPVTVASSVPEAIAFLRGENQPDVPSLCAVVTELYLPGDDGFELLKWIRAQPHLEGLPVVVLTASIRGYDFEHADSLGASKVFAKSCNPEDLREVAEYIRDLSWQQGGFPSGYHAASSDGGQADASELLGTLAARLK
jgi:CheY-like chemotaxis protein